MKNKVLVSGLTSLLLILSCQMDGNNLGKINTKNSFKIASNNEPVPESSSGIFPNYDTEQFNKDELEQSSQKSVLDVNSIANKKQTLNFDSPPPDTAPIVDGVIIVFYHNNDKFRVKTSNSISSTNQSNSNQVNAILEKYNVKSIQSSGYYDPADKNKIVCKSEKKKKESEDDKKFKTKSKNNDHENENEDNDKEKEPDNDKCNTLNYVDSSVTTQKIAEQQQLMSTLYNGEFPDDLSVHVYNFPPNVNTRQIAKELRSLPFIRTAYPALQYSSSSIGNNCSVSSSLLGLTTPSSVGAKSSDPFFTNITNVPNPDFFGSYETRPADKNKDYYWFDRHQIFRGWEIIDSNGGVESPKIAVIDEGFDVDQNALDRPNYLSGYSITYNPVWWRPWSNFDIKNGDLKSKLSPSWHGSEVSSVIGSPRNNGQGLAGVAPQTQILPIRVAQSRQYIYGLNAKSTTSSLEIKEALNMASSEPTIDVINISLTSEGIVLPEDPIVLKAVADAIAKNKVVAIAAGNSMSPIDPKVTIPNGCMIVGGTSNRKQVLYDKRHIPQKANLKTYHPIMEHIYG